MNQVEKICLLNLFPSIHIDINPIIKQVYFENIDKSIFDIMPLNLKIYIASFDENTWIQMIICDEHFRQYAHTSEGIKKFIMNFTRIYRYQAYILGNYHQLT